MDCFAEPVIGRRFAPTRWLAMTIGDVSPASSHPPVVDPVLPRQHALRAHGLDGEVAGQCHRTGQMIDLSLLPRGALYPQHAGAAHLAVALQGRGNAGDVVAGAVA